MQPRTLQQVLGELDSTYQPQIDTLRQRQTALPGQLQADEQGLAAKQESAFGDIVNGARRRGLGFSGIPLGEQAKYSATEYMPALARLRQSGHEQALSLEDAINGVYERRNTMGQQIYQNEQNQFEQRRQFDANLALQKQQMAAQQAAAGGGFSPSLGMPANNPRSATASQRADKGFNFTGPNGQAISAAAYAAVNGIPFRTLLAQMAKAGDKGAQQALGFVGDDFGYDPGKINRSNQNIYNALVWGTNKQIGPR